MVQVGLGPKNEGTNLNKMHSPRFFSQICENCKPIPVFVLIKEILAKIRVLICEHKNFTEAHEIISKTGQIQNFSDF